MTLSAKCATSLRDLAGKYIEWTEGSRDAGEVSSWLCTRRRHFRFRWCFVVNSDAEFRRQLRLKIGEHSDDPSPSVPPSGELDVVFVYPGWGQQHRAIGAGLFSEQPEFAKHVSAVDELFKQCSGYSAVERFSLFSGNADVSGDGCKPALFFYQVAQTRLLLSRGVTAVACVGGGLGDLAASWASGALDLRTCVEMLVLRMRAPARREFEAGVAAALGSSRGQRRPSLPLYSACGLRARPEAADYWRDNVTSGVPPDMATALREVLSDLDASRLALVEVAGMSVCVEALRAAKELVPAHPGVELVTAMSMPDITNDRYAGLLQIAQLYNAGYNGQYIKWYRIVIY